MSLATIEGVSLYFESVGDGQPVVLIHGALISDAFRTFVSDPVLPKAFHLITYRRRGYSGSSQAYPGFSVLDQARDCLHLLHHLGIERAHVVGHSFGGAIALEMARSFPDRVRSLTLLEPALMVGASAAGYKDSLEAGIKHFKEIDAETAVDEMLRARWPDYRTHLSGILPDGFRDAVAAAQASFDVELPSLFDWHFDEADARAIVQPVLSVTGSESKGLSPRFQEVHEWLLAKVPDCNGYVLQGAHHFLQMENPTDMAPALNAFWSHHPIGTRHDVMT
jgi:pimeloyl-ACP methyl ester carboxylesterase